MSKVKHQLIEIATETAQKAGVQAVTMRELGQAVGIKSSSVMYHFNNKDGLMQHIATSYSADFFAKLKVIETRHDTATGRLQSLIDLFEEALQQEKMCLCGMLAADSTQLDSATQTLARQFFERLETWVKNALSASAVDSQLAPLIVSSLEGAMLLDKLDGRNGRLSAVRHWLITQLEE